MNALPPEPNAAQNPGPVRSIPQQPTFGSAVSWTVLGTILPGLGLWRAGRKVAGGIIMGVVVCSILGLSIFSVARPALVKSSATDPNVLYVVAAVLAVWALGWTAVITVTHLALRPYPATVGQRIGGAALVGALCLIVGSPLGFASNVAFTTAQGINAVFGPETGPAVDAADPWKDKPQLNVLILGGDSGTGRDAELGIRPDSVSVASINTHTGAITLVNIPRQTAKMPFPSNSPLHKYYPNGFYDGSNSADDNYFLNAMYRNLPASVPKNVLGQTKNLGAAAMKISVGEALGLKIDYYVMVNMDGFKDIINAIGGVTVNVNDPIPLGGHNASGNKPAVKPGGWIKIGPNQHLNGTQALWFARGRYGTTDYKRMERQQCVVNAVVKQADAATILTNYQSIVSAGTKTVFTDVPRSLLEPLVELAVKAKQVPIHNVLLNEQNHFNTANPDWVTVRAQIRKAQAAGAASAASTPSSSAPSAGQSSSTSPGSSASPSGSASTKPKPSLDQACAYHPNQ